MQERTAQSPLCPVLPVSWPLARGLGMSGAPALTPGSWGPPSAVSLASPASSCTSVSLSSQGELDPPARGPSPHCDYVPTPSATSTREPSWIVPMLPGASGLTPGIPSVRASALQWEQWASLFHSWETEVPSRDPQAKGHAARVWWCGPCFLCPLGRGKNVCLAVSSLQGSQLGPALPHTWEGVVPKLGHPEILAGWIPWARLACCLSKSSCWGHRHQDSAGQSRVTPTSSWGPPLWDSMTPAVGTGRGTDPPRPGPPPPRGRRPLPLPSSLLAVRFPLPGAASPSVPSLLLKTQPRASSGTVTVTRAAGSGVLTPRTGGRRKASTGGVVHGSFQAASTHSEVCGLDCARVGDPARPRQP